MYGRPAQSLWTGELYVRRGGPDSLSVPWCPDVRQAKTTHPQNVLFVEARLLSGAGLLEDWKAAVERARVWLCFCCAVLSFTLSQSCGIFRFSFRDNMINS